jgi:hypothetical protein
MHGRHRCEDRSGDFDPGSVPRTTTRQITKKSPKQAFRLAAPVSAVHGCGSVPDSHRLPLPGGRHDLSFLYLFPPQPPKSTELAGLWLQQEGTRPPPPRLKVGCQHVQRARPREVLVTPFTRSDREDGRAGRKAARRAAWVARRVGTSSSRRVGPSLLRA